VAAQSDTGNLGVSASVTGSCRLRSISPVAFGTYDPLLTHETNPLDGTGSINIGCTKGTGAVTIALGQGSYYTTGRRMNGGIASADYLNYALYQDSGRTDPWGEGGDAMVLATEPPSSGTAYTVYGQVPGAQDVSEGSYADTVLVTVSW
jgi:spore coat protein U-like protein